LTSALTRVADLQRQLEAASTESKTLEQRLTKAERERDEVRNALTSAQATIAKLAKLDAALAVTAGSGWSFRDPKADGGPCPFCPELVVIPSGNFEMGSPVSEQGNSNERPQHAVTIAKQFALE